MSYFKKLNLPENPLLDSRAISQSHIPKPYKISTPEEVLTKEVLDIFSSLDLRVKMVVFHGQNNKSPASNQRMIHSDLTYDNTVEGNWRRIVSGVNWEIEGSYADFYWFDMSGIKECWPDETAMFKEFNGIHFGERRQLWVPENVKLLDSTTLDGPTLVRTDIPHTTKYNNPNTNRVGVSVRFFEEDFNYSWAGALEKFKPIFLGK